MKGKTIVWLVVAVIALGAIGPTASRKIGQWAGRGAVEGAKGVGGAAVGATPEVATGVAGAVCPPGMAGLRCAWPTDYLTDQANLARAQAARAAARTPPTTMPPAEPPPPKPYPTTGRPYVPPPAVPMPPAPPPASDLPQLGEAPSGGPLGALLEEVPAIGPAIAQALTTGAKALPAGPG